MTSSLGRPARAWLPIALLGMGLAAWCEPARAQQPTAVSAPPRTMVLPFRTIGISDTTAEVVAAILVGELEHRRIPMVSTHGFAETLRPGSTACVEIDCATELGRRFGAERVVFGSLSRLGAKVIVRVRAVRVGESESEYADQLTATSEDDLDAVARRIADGIASGQPDASRATVTTITDQETLTPRRRASRAGAGLRAGFLFPAGGSYGGADQLSGFRLAFRYETQGTFVETTPVLGFMWGEGNFEWTILDVHVGHMLGDGDWSPYFGGGLGMHTVSIERRTPVTYPYGVYDVAYSQTETTLTADVGVGLMMLRTYDFSLLVDLRFHIVFSEFQDVGGDGAHGLTLSFGTTR